MVDANNKDFWTDIPEYSDDEIIKILKKRKLYQVEAANLAIQEAIKRGLIHSEQDLFKEDFNEINTTIKLFPIIEKEENRIKIRKSIGRVLLIVGAIPVIWGVIKLANNSFFEGLLLILLGSIWIFAAAKIMRGVVLKMVNLLFIMLAASIAYVVKLFVEMKGFKLMDFVIPVIMVSFITYGLLFIKKLYDA